LHQFIADQMYLLLYIVVAGGLVTVFFYLFYKKSVAYQQMQNRSVHDNLTGLYNRRGLDEVLPELIRQSQRQQEPISVLFIDIDHFKWFNDHCGHEAGDQVLSNLARLLQRHLKRPLDFACRWGGEEFVIVLPNTDEAGAVHLAETILVAVRRMSTAKESLAKSQITVSIGISSMIVTPENIQDDLIDQADKAMFSAKNNGRDQLVVYRTLI
jgi:two-component system chemotaxis family response regulator WspR